MEHVEIDAEGAEFLAKEGLERFGDFMRLEGSLIGDDGTRSTRRVVIGGRTFYLKKAKAPAVGAVFGTLLSGSRPRGMAFGEMLHARELAKAGFPVMAVVAGGERRRLGWPGESFVLTREVRGEDLDPFFRKAPAADQRVIAGRFAGLLGGLHAAGFYARVRMKDVLIGEGGAAEGKFCLIDREVRHPYPRAFSVAKAKALVIAALVRHRNMGIRADAWACRRAARSYAAAVAGKWPVGGRELFRLCRNAVCSVKGR